MITFPASADLENKLQLAKSLAFVYDSPEARPFVDWLQAELTKMDEMNRVELDDNMTRIRQGASQAVNTIISELQGGNNLWLNLKKTVDYGMR